jgi:hypothetical protein
MKKWIFIWVLGLIFSISLGREAIAMMPKEGHSMEPIPMQAFQFIFQNDPLPGL